MRTDPSCPSTWLLSPILRSSPSTVGYLRLMHRLLVPTIQLHRRSRGGLPRALHQSGANCQSRRFRIRRVHHRPARTACAWVGRRGLVSRCRFPTSHRRREVTRQSLLQLGSIRPMPLHKRHAMTVPIRLGLYYHRRHLLQPPHFYLRGQLGHQIRLRDRLPTNHPTITVSWIRLPRPSLPGTWPMSTCRVRVNSSRTHIRGITRATHYPVR